MKRVIAAILAFMVAMSLAGCSMGQTSETPTEAPNPSQEYHNALKGETTLKPTPVNYMDEIKQEIHDELFREETEDTLDIVDRIFKYMNIETVKSFVEGDDASIQMNITTINAGRAWVVGMERYAIACAENLFAENYNDDATLYSYYLEEFESCVRKADYITIPVVVEMDYRNCRWEWDINDDVINAITGYLLAAIEGDINSATIWTPTINENKNEVEMPEVSEPVETPITKGSPVSILGYDVSENNDGNICLVVKYNWTNTTDETIAYWARYNDRAFQDGVELDTTYPSYKNKYNELYSNKHREIRPGTSIDFVIFYELRDVSDPSDVEIEVYSWDGYKDVIYAQGISAF